MRRILDLLRRPRSGFDAPHIQPAARRFGVCAAAFSLLACLIPAAAQELPDVPAIRDDLTEKDLARVRAITAPTTDFSKPEQFELMQGGAATTRKRVNADSFSQFSANITFEEESTFKLGNAIFRKNWVSSPSSTQASDGLGPLFNARACQSCHLKDGRGHPPEGKADATSMFLRLAREAETEEEKQAVAAHHVPGLVSEGRMRIDYEEVPVTLDDGTVVSLRKPAYSVENLGYGPLDARTTLSPRIANPMIGLGLVEQIHPADILANADPDDADGDGISGRASIVRDTLTGELTLGRFGWKAQTATIRQQSADALAGDIGISSPEVPHHWGDCTPAQQACLDMPTGVQPRLGDTEAPEPIMDLVTFYSQNLAVPARRNLDKPDVLAGKQAFYDMGCASCHTPKFVTRRDAPNKAHAFQLIWPYSDFLLHDMGEGLADGQQVGVADGYEWRTPPLWGIGLTQRVNNHTFFLHDGRARNLTEAIVWHGGEAQSARDNFAAASAEEREALIKFLESL
jgi:CxxC motif-containing protein (DUF1111 family)